MGYQKLQALGATPLIQVYTAGGGAKNLIWQIIRERYLGVPVGSSSYTEAAYGTALLAKNSYGQQKRRSLMAFSSGIKPDS